MDTLQRASTLSRNFFPTFSKVDHSSRKEFDFLLHDSHLGVGCFHRKEWVPVGSGHFKADIFKKGYFERFQVRVTPLRPDFLGESLLYDFSLSEKKICVSNFIFILSLPFKFGTEILHYYKYFCLKIILFGRLKLFFHIFSRQHLFKKSAINLKIKNSGLNVYPFTLRGPT